MNNEAASGKCSKGQRVQRTRYGRCPGPRPSNTAESLAQVGSPAGLLTEKRVSKHGSHRRNQVLLRVQNKAGGKIVVLT